MTTEERIENLEKRVKVLENLLKLTAVDDWIDCENAKISLFESLIGEMDYEKLSDDEKAEIDLVINTFRKTNRLLEFIVTWSAKIQPLPELGLDKEI